MLLCSAVLSLIVATAVHAVDIAMEEITESKAKCWLSYTSKLVTPLNFKLLFVFNTFLVFCTVLCQFCFFRFVYIYTIWWVWLLRVDRDATAAKIMKHNFDTVPTPIRAGTQYLLFTALQKCVKGHKLHVDSSVCAVWSTLVPFVAGKMSNVDGSREFRQKFVHA